MYSTYHRLYLPIKTTGVPVVPFIDLGTSGGTLTGVDDGASNAISLPSPLMFGLVRFTRAYVSGYFQYLHPKYGLNVFKLTGHQQWIHQFPYPIYWFQSTNLPNNQSSGCSILG